MKIIRAGGRMYRLFDLRGEILNFENPLPLNFSRCEGGYAYKGNEYHSPVTVLSDGMLQGRLYLKDSKGTVHELNLSRFKLNCREAQQLKIVWAIREDHTTGPYIAVKNLDTRAAHFDREVLEKMYRPAYTHVSVCIPPILFAGYFLDQWILAGSTAGFMICLGCWLIWKRGRSGSRKFMEAFDFDHGPVK